MQADTHALFEYPLGKTLEAKLVKGKKPTKTKKKNGSRKGSSSKKIRKKDTLAGKK